MLVTHFCPFKTKSATAHFKMNTKSISTKAESYNSLLSSRMINERNPWKGIELKMFYTVVWKVIQPVSEKLLVPSNSHSLYRSLWNLSMCYSCWGRCMSSDLAKEVGAVHGKRVNKPGRPDARCIPSPSSDSRFQHVKVRFHVTGSSFINGHIRHVHTFPLSKLQALTFPFKSTDKCL